MRYLQNNHGQCELTKWVLISGSVLFLLGGCSSRLQTTITSGEQAQATELAQAVPVQLPEEEVKPQSIKVDEIPVEAPATPVISQGASEDAEEKRGIAAQTQSSSESQPTPQGEAQPNATARLTFSEKETFSPKSAPASQPSSGSGAKGIPPIAIFPETPALPHGSGSFEETEEIATANPDHSPGNLSSDGESGIPAVSFNPEPQALPRAQEESSPEMATTEEPMQVVKAMPTEEEPIRTEEPMQIAKVVPTEPTQINITEKALDEALNDVFFDYDRFAIREDAQTLLRTNADLLTSKFADKKILIEGHCDERGTQSYNMVLGKRRAEAVKSFLGDLGIPEEQIDIVSYGKARPFCAEQTQECWQQNRRGHFVIK